MDGMGEDRMGGKVNGMSANGSNGWKRVKKGGNRHEWRLQDIPKCFERA
jgi:hypothetical protein